jgi:hypothetical protein
MWSVVDRNVVMRRVLLSSTAVACQGAPRTLTAGDRLFRVGLLPFASFPLDFEISSSIRNDVMPLFLPYSVQFVINLSPFHLTLRNLIY